jgi:hypothetical protein
MYPVTALLCVMSSSECQGTAGVTWRQERGSLVSYNAVARRLHALQKDEQLLLLPEPLASTNHMNWLYTAQPNINVITTKQKVEIRHLLRSMRSTWTKAPLVPASYLVFKFRVEM